jgi:adenylate kinase family enzyme
MSIKILIFGNSGSGKSTLAKKLSKTNKIAYLDLDILAWLPVVPPERAFLDDSKDKIQAFISKHENWVIEGCYTDLLEMVSIDASQIIFMNLDVSLCIDNAKNRLWESHKYESKEAQDKNLAMLIQWIEQYPEREDVCSYKAHINFYKKFLGKKTMYLNNKKT